CSEMGPHLSALGCLATGEGGRKSGSAGGFRVFRTIQPVVVTAIALCVSAMPALSAPRNAKPEPAFEEPHGADLNQGKPPSEIFKSDCSVCHKSPQGLAKSGGAGLQGFLRQHYTTGAPQAAAMAGYLASVGGSGAAAK